MTTQYNHIQTSNISQQATRKILLKHYKSHLAKVQALCWSMNQIPSAIREDRLAHSLVNK